MFAIHSDNLERQLRLANNGPQQTHQMQQTQRMAGKQMQQFPRRAALSDVSNQRGAQGNWQNAQKTQKPMTQRIQDEINKKAHQQPGQAPQMLMQQRPCAPHTDTLREQELNHAKEQIYLREQAMAEEAARSKIQNAVGRAPPQYHHHHQQQPSYQNPHPQQWQQVQQAGYAPQQSMMMPAATPVRKRGRKKRTAKRQPVVQGYNHPLSPLVENIIGELPTPARMAYLSRAAATSPSPKGILSYAAERLVSSENASTGDRVVIASQFAQIAFFRKYVGKIGVLVRRSEAPGGCGWIVDFGEPLGRQFFSTGGPGNVCHLAFASSLPLASSPRAPPKSQAVSGWAVDLVKSPADPGSGLKKLQLKLPAPTGEAAQWELNGQEGTEERVQTKIDLTANLHERIQSELQCGLQMSQKVLGGQGGQGGGGAPRLSPGGKTALSAVQEEDAEGEGEAPVQHGALEELRGQQQQQQGKTPPRGILKKTPAGAAGEERNEQEETEDMGLLQMLGYRVQTQAAVTGSGGEASGLQMPMAQWEQPQLLQLRQHAHQQLHQARSPVHAAPGTQVVQHKMSPQSAQVYQQQMVPHYHSNHTTHPHHHQQIQQIQHHHHAGSGGGAHSSPSGALQHVTAQQTRQVPHATMDYSIPMHGMQPVSQGTTSTAPFGQWGATSNGSALFAPGSNGSGLLSQAPVASPTRAQAASSVHEAPRMPSLMDLFFSRK